MSRARGEWPLVAFTLLGQTAAGMGASMVLTRVVFRGVLDEAVLGRLLVVPLVAAGVILSVALLVSMRHLARPARAWRALHNVRASWVSLEVVLGAAFAGAWAIVAWLEVTDTGTRALRDGAAAVMAVLGIGFVWTMGRVYRLPARPDWNHAATPLEFFATSAWLGALATATTLAAAMRWRLGPAALFPEQLVAADDAVRGLVAVSTAFAILHGVAGAVQARVRVRASREASLPLSPAVSRRHREADVFRAMLTAASAVCAAAFAFRRPAWSVLEGQGLALIAGAIVCAAAASVVGRVVFYAEKPRAGI